MAVTTLCGQDTSFKKNAIFLTYEEFKNNTPSIDTLKLHLAYLRNYKSKVQYETGDGKLVDYKHRIWGFSDTTDLYVWHRDRFNQVVAAGRYYVFSYIKIVHNSEPDRDVVGYHTPRERFNGGVRGDARVLCVMDYNTGRIEDLNEKKIREILGQDQKLLDEYQEDTEQDDLIVEYIRRFNERHPLKNN